MPAVAGYAVVCLCAAAFTGFHVGVNDFWANVALARQVEWSSPSTLYNAFFPFGYTLLLTGLGAWPAVPALLLNIACGGVLLWATWLLGRRITDARWGIVAIALLALQPPIFRYVTTPGPDIPAAALLALGFYRLFAADAPDRGRPRDAVLTGALLGAAALLRYHALVFAAAAIVATALVRRSPRGLPYVAFGMACVYAPQMAIAVGAGHSPLHTGQAVIFYKLAHGFDWFHATSEPAPSSAWAVVAAAPGAFARAYLRQLQGLLPLLVPAAAIAFLAADAACRKFGRAALITATLYVLVVATGGSSRGGLPVHFLAALAMTALLRDALTRAGRARPAVASAAAILVTIWGLMCLRDNYGILKYRRIDNQSYRAVETLLRADGVNSADQVFATDFSLYLPSLPGQTPRTNGTWVRLENDRYNARLPELCDTSADCFRRDARGAGVTHVVLTPDAEQLSPELGAVYARARIPGFELAGRSARFAVFRIHD